MLHRHPHDQTIDMIYVPVSFFEGVGLDGSATKPSLSIYMYIKSFRQYVLGIASIASAWTIITFWHSGGSPGMQSARRRRLELLGGTSLDPSVPPRHLETS